jgi:hypothetical protein
MDKKRNGNRIYSFEIPGKAGWKAKYLKEIHEKYPVDNGHIKLSS